MNGAYELDILTGIMVTTRRNNFTQHKVVGEDGVPVTIGASGSGAAAEVEEGLGHVEPVVMEGAGRGRGTGGGRGRGRGPVPPQWFGPKCVRLLQMP